MKKFDTRKVVGLGLFTAIVVVLQILGSFIKFGPFSVSLVLIPIVVGAAVYDYRAGAWLGLVFGLVVLLSGDAGLFLTVNPFGAIVTVIAKGVLAGLAAGLVYRLVARKGKHEYLGVVAAAVACPVVNTGIFLIGCFLFFYDTVAGWAAAAGFSGSVAGYMIVGLVGLNFVFELLLNVVLSPVIVRLVRIGKKS